MNLVKKRILKVKENKLKTFGYKNYNLLYCHDDGDFYEPKSVYRQYLKILKRNGISPHRFHDLRGSQISLLHESGVPLKTISENAGHASTEITDRKYCRVLSTDHMCADKVQEIFFNSATQ